MFYRREIDGLRALAVVPVILFHAGFQVFSGGYVGVDVFFVISGHLITAIILADLEAGRFSVVNFYERRVRRILPALFLVVAVCLPFAWFWLLPRDVKDFSQSLMAVPAFASNVLFWMESGYFDTEAELKPLLHTWSLAVEEQFYVFFPLLLMLAWRLGRRRLVGLVWLVAIGSLLVAHWGAFNYPEATFFLLPTRAWELAAGALTAFYIATPASRDMAKATRQLLSSIGLALIAISIFAFDKKTPFPSLYALVPTVGAVLIILFARPDTYAGYLLGSRTFVGIGLVSYSAYLWHQPLLVFARHRSLEKPGVGLLVLLVILTFVLAYLSWRLVERPFRSKGFLHRRMIFTLAAGGSVALASVGVLGQVTDGFLFRESYKITTSSLENRLRFNRGMSALCEDQFNDLSECRTVERPEVIVWGDSYAMHLVPGFLASNPDVGIVQATVSMCGPVLDAAPLSHDYPRPWAEKCLQSNDKVLEYMKRTKSLKYVVVGSLFEQYASGEWSLLRRDGTIVNGRDDGFRLFKQTLQTLRELGLTPIVFAPTPQDDRNIGRCLGKAVFFGYDLSTCDVSLEKSKIHQKQVHEFLDKVASEARVVRFDDELCLDNTCKAALGDVFIYRDRGHLSYEGSALLGTRMNFYGAAVGAGQ